MKLQQAAEGFLFHKSADGIANNTIASYRRNLREFTQFCAGLGITDIQDVTSDHIRRYLYHLRAERNLAQKTIKNQWATLSSLWTWAAAELKIPHIIRDHVPCPKAPPPDIVPFTKDEIVKLLDATEKSRRWKTERRRAVKRTRPEASRDRAIILLLLDTGIRASELCNLNRGDVDLARGLVIVRGAKHRLSTKTRHVYLGRTARKSLWRYLADREDKLGEPISDDDPLIAASNWRTRLDRHAIRRMLSRCADRAGVANVYPHRFRHTFAITYLRNGGDPFTLQALLGHSSLDMVKHYIRIAEQDCENVHRRASPADNWRL